VCLASGLSAYFTIKTTWLVCYLHAFARKPVWDEKRRLEAESLADAVKMRVIEEEKRRQAKEEEYEQAAERALNRKFEAQDKMNVGVKEITMKSAKVGVVSYSDSSGT